MLNQCNFIGRVGKPPELRNTNAGKKIANISLAVSEKYNGEEKTEWLKVVCISDKLSEIIERYVNKGDLIYISGKMQTRSWEDQSGVKKYSTEIVLGFDGKMQMLGGKRQQDDAPRQETSGGWDAPETSAMDDSEIPF